MSFPSRPRTIEEAWKAHAECCGKRCKPKIGLHWVEIAPGRSIAIAVPKIETIIREGRATTTKAESSPPTPPPQETP